MDSFRGPFNVVCLYMYSNNMIFFHFTSIDKRTNTVVAIKIIDLEEAEDEIEDIQQEITVLSQCDSAFVTKYHGSYLKVLYSVMWACFMFTYMECVFSDKASMTSDLYIVYNRMFILYNKWMLVL